jgi:hypothetical protein
MKSAAAAEALGWDPGKLSRLENGRAHVLPDDLAALLSLYKVDQSMWDGFQRLMRDAARSVELRHGSGGVLTARYADLIALESDAEAVRVYALAVVPGLLQTAAYARAITGGVALTRSADEVDALVKVRRERQAVLSRLPYWVVIEEAVLRRSFRSHPGVMREQLRRLLDVAARPNVRVQVIPMSADPHPGCAGGFDLVTFTAPMPAVIVEIENLGGSAYVAEPTDAKLWDAAWQRLTDEALSVGESLTLIERIEGST